MKSGQRDAKEKNQKKYYGVIIGELEIHYPFDSGELRNLEQVTPFFPQCQEQTTKDLNLSHTSEHTTQVQQRV